MTGFFLQLSNGKKRKERMERNKRKDENIERDKKREDKTDIWAKNTRNVQLEKYRKFKRKTTWEKCKKKEESK